MDSLQLPTRGRHKPKQQSDDGGRNKQSEGRVLKVAGESNGNKFKQLPREHQNLK